MAPGARASKRAPRGGRCSLSLLVAGLLVWAAAGREEGTRSLLAAQERMASLWAQTAGRIEEVEGEVEVFVEDHPWGARRRLALRQEGRRLWLQGLDAALMRTGLRVRVRGVRRGGRLIVSSAIPLESEALLSPAMTGTHVTHRIALLLVSFSDRTAPPSLDEQARHVLLSVGEFFEENSSGRFSLVGDVIGGVALALSASVCDPFRLAAEAQALVAASGRDLSLYEHIVYVFPRNACAWWGLGTLGGSPSMAWINGTLTWDVLAHELGHGLGLSHARALECGWVALEEACQILEYGDTVDIMGTGVGHLNAFHKEKLGWIGEEDARLLRVTHDGTFRLAPYQGGRGPVALKVWRSREAHTMQWFYIEYRRPQGFDRFLQRNANISQGVLIRLGLRGDSEGSFLLDMTPETSSWFDPALTVGRQFVDPRTGITIAVHEADPDGITLSITGVGSPR